jgi:hypothetical protein
VAVKGKAVEEVAAVPRRQRNDVTVFSEPGGAEAHHQLGCALRVTSVVYHAIEPGSPRQPSQQLKQGACYLP